MSSMRILNFTSMICNKINSNGKICSVLVVKNVVISLIGRNARVSRNERKNVIRLNIGDYSEVEV